MRDNKKEFRDIITDTPFGDKPDVYVISNINQHSNTVRSILEGKLLYVGKNERGYIVFIDIQTNEPLLYGSKISHVAHAAHAANAGIRARVYTDNREFETYDLIQITNVPRD